MRIWLMIFAILAVAVLPAAAQQKMPPAGEKSSRAVKAPAVPASPINLNTATQAQLESLPGLGPKVAERILDYRKQNGAFKKVEDLMNVKGVGEKSFLKLKPFVTVSDKPKDSR